MSAEMLRISARVTAGRLPLGLRESAVSRRPRGASAYRFIAPSARGLRPGAPGRLASAEKSRVVTAEMRGFAASISAVRAVPAASEMKGERV
jgi:hypothetical protein